MEVTDAKTKAKLTWAIQQLDTYFKKYDSYGPTLKEMYQEEYMSVILELKELVDSLR